MNILYMMNYAGKGGTETYVKTLTAHKKTGDSVHFIYNMDGDLCTQMKNLGVTPMHVRMRHPFDIFAAIKIAAYCRQNRIDIIHTQFQRENYISVLVGLLYPGVRLVYTSHINLQNNAVWKFTNTVMARRDDAIIAVCSEGRRLLVANRMPKAKIHLVFNGISVPDFIKRHQSGNPFKFITVTRFTAEKGIFFLLNAAKALKTLTDKPFQLMFVGDGPLLDEAKAFSARYGLTGYVTFMGFRQDVARLLEAADVFINSSESEALSFAILEAMAKGLPVIATRVGGNPDIVNSRTNCGVLVNYGDTDAMAGAMRQLLDDEAALQAYAKGAVNAVRTIFNMNTMLDQTYKIYEAIVRR